MKIHNQRLFNLIQKYPFISKLVTITDGFIQHAKDERDYMFGANKIDKVVLKADGQWTDVLPEDEYQAGNRFDSMSCTCFSLLNVIEMLAKVKFKENWNKSDRFTAKLSGVGPNGNSLVNVLKSVSKNNGLVDEIDWSWSRITFDWNSYFSPIPMSIQLKGKEWLKHYQVYYERVTENKQLMMEALKYSPLYLSGYAWYARGEKYYSYSTANHAFTVVGYKEGEYWLAYDSYSPFLKKLDWDFRFSNVYVIVIKKANEEIKKLKERGFKYIMRSDVYNGASGQVYELTENNELIELTEQQKLEIGIKSLSDNKIMTGVSEKYYFNLLN